MKTLFLVDGAAGTGKSDLLRYLTQKKKHVAVFVSKYTTRQQRPEEMKRKTPLDLRFPSLSYSEFMQRTKNPNFYWYTYGTSGHNEEFYGFYKSDVEHPLSEHDVVLVIVRDFETIARIKRDFRRIWGLFRYGEKSNDLF